MSNRLAQETPSTESALDRMLRTKLPFPMPAEPVQKESRAVQRLIEAGNYVDCVHCGDQVKFQAKVRTYQIICNIYTDGKWDRVEHYHFDCYEQAGSPFGEMVRPQLPGHHQPVAEAVAANGAAGDIVAERAEQQNHAESSQESQAA